MSKEEEVISNNEYDKSHPVFLKIRKEFAKMLKANIIVKILIK